MSQSLSSPSQQASGTAASRRRAEGNHQHAASAAANALAAAPPPVVLLPAPSAAAAAAAAASRAPSPRPPRPAARAIILHPRHAYRLPRPLPVVLPPTTSSLGRPHPGIFGHYAGRRGPSLAAALPIDALTSVAARVGDGRSLAAFAATCRACRAAAYDERLWRRECERRFGPIMAQPPPPSQPHSAAGGGSSGGSGTSGSSSSGSTSSGNRGSTRGPASPRPAEAPGFSWRRLYAFNAHAYDAVVAAAREAERARAISRLIGGPAARRWLGARAALGVGA